MIKLEKKEMCNGCHGCMSICPVKCIDMKEDFEGFKYPEVAYDKCIKCSMCVKVCPVKAKKEVQLTEPKAYACYNKDEEVRMESSSGGIFTLLAEKVVSDGGAVFGAVFDKKLNLKHKYVEDMDGLKEFRGSKYLQSEIGDTFNKVLEFLTRDRKVLFSGTPCQVGGLKSFLERKLPEEKLSNLLAVDFICHGVPSPKVWKKYKDFLSKGQNDQIKSVSFRDKSQSWKRYNTKFIFKNSEKAWLASTDKYMRAFLTDICLRPACHECGFKSKVRISDITMADFWGIHNVAPEMDDDKGTSLILIHSEEGNKYYSSILKDIFSKEVDIDLALKSNSAALKSVKQHPKRSEYFEGLDIMTFDKLHNKYVKLPLYIEFKRKIRKKIGSVFRKLDLR